MIFKKFQKRIKYLETSDIFNDWTWYDRILEFEGYPKEKNGLDSMFMAQGLQGYLEFLHSVKNRGFLQGPPVNIDLFWHSHQLFPKQYELDCLEMFGDILYHMPIGTVARWVNFASLINKEEPLKPKE